MPEKAYKVAFSGVVSALSAALMFLSGVIPFSSYALPYFAGILLVAVVIELGRRFAFMSYVVVSVLSLLLAPDKEAVLLFILFFGFYPIVKSLVEGKLRLKAIQYVLKFALFNICMIAFYYAGKFILHIPDDSFIIFGVSLPLVFLLLGNAVFILYDFAVSAVVVRYITQIRGKFFKDKL